MAFPGLALASRRVSNPIASAFQIQASSRGSGWGRNSGGERAGQGPIEASWGADSTDDEDEKQHFHRQHPLPLWNGHVEALVDGGESVLRTCLRLLTSCPLSVPRGQDRLHFGEGEESKCEETRAANSVTLNFDGFSLPRRRPSRDIDTTSEPQWLRATCAVRTPVPCKFRCRSSLGEGQVRHRQDANLGRRQLPIVANLFTITSITIPSPPLEPTAT